MSGNLLPLFGLGASLLLFPSCAPTEKTTAWDQAVSAASSALQPASSLTNVRVPVLKSPRLERAWGKPEIKTTADGGYLLTYSDPKHSFTRLLIYGIPSPLPALTTPPLLSGEEMVNDQLTGFQRPQSWRQVTVTGQTQRWYQESTSGGADGAYYSTEGFSRTAPDGRTGHYRLVAEAGDDPQIPAQWFSSVSF